MNKHRRKPLPVKKAVKKYAHAEQVKTLVVPPDHVGHVVVPVGMIPAIVPGKTPHEVAIIPVEAKPEKESWLDYIFGPPEKIQSKP